MEKPTHNYHEKEDSDADNELANDTQAKTITNIYYDCLERIFDFLDLNSLMNVAGTCKRLQIAATAKFRDEYGSKKVGIVLANSSKEKPHITENEIVIQGWKLCLPFLRCFGAKIGNLNLCSSNKHTTKTYVEQYIEQYCTGLTSIAYYCWNFEFSSLLDMINKNEHILTLKLARIECYRKPEDISIADLSRFAAEHRMVMELDLKDCRFSAYNAIYLIEQLKLLKTFQFRVKDHMECGRLLKHLGRKWKVNISEISNDEFQISMSRDTSEMISRFLDMIEKIKD